MFSLKNAMASWMIRRSLKERILPLEVLESRHTDDGNPLFNDSSYFLGRGEDGSYMVVRMAFRTTRHPEYWLAFHLPSKGTFMLDQLEGEVKAGFQMGNLQFKCLEPGKRWNIIYSGKIQQEGASCVVNLNLMFEASSPLVNFKQISRPEDIAPVIAREKWTRGFLGNLKEIQKVHLEQGGYITGTITLDGYDHPVHWRSIRDHSWGTRAWETWKRHVWLGGVLDNGEAFNLSMISYDFMGQLSAGYITSGEELSFFDPLPEMEQFASDPVLPARAAIAFQARDGTSHLLEMQIRAYFDFTMDSIYRIREGMGDFVFDGIPGKGVAEFGLNRKYYDPITG